MSKPQRIVRLIKLEHLNQSPPRWTAKARFSDGKDLILLLLDERNVNRIDAQEGGAFSLASQHPLLWSRVKVQNLLSTLKLFLEDKSSEKHELRMSIMYCLEVCTADVRYAETVHAFIGSLPHGLRELWIECNTQRPGTRTRDESYQARQSRHAEFTELLLGFGRYAEQEFNCWGWATCMDDLHDQKKHGRGSSCVDSQTGKPRCCQGRACARCCKGRACLDALRTCASHRIKDG